MGQTEERVLDETKLAERIAIVRALVIADLEGCGEGCSVEGRSREEGGGEVLHSKRVGVVVSGGR